ncbi:ribosome hibernation-promoting factor, HPF/YfiA family [Floricoccus penangensis]|uniref:Ribosome hibernation promoting factor n=1 Tax=Floricoccus penangensis TaxID=1859475 RepID=A0A9Q5JHY9_9LACT|nr:ribosome-associated translation inhibitor RaiA [Floricoccus penangensis]OFI47608.1 ribosomal subunit interface protein [Floricoccus penangensis]URZ87867.1 ribosome-associated translation inhibitor RaiA [Floricoccus penangensis]
MIRFNIRGENIEVTPAIRDYVQNKVSKIERYFNDDRDINAHVNLKVYQNKNAKVEVTIPMKQLTLRAEDTSQDMYGSIDLVVDKLERQIRKYKTKTNRRKNVKGVKDYPVEELVDFEVTEEVDEGAKIVRTKEIDLKPMDAEEAVLQMEMSGHDFFIFTDADTDSTSIVYLREDGNYGLIETK